MMFRLSLLIGCLAMVVAQKKKKKIDAAWSDVAFNKFAWIDGAQPIDITFPLTNDQAEYLKQSSGSISIVLPGPDEECRDDLFQKVNEYLEKKKLNPPLYPSEKKFWFEFEEVVNVQTLLKQNKKGEISEPLNQVMPITSLPELWKDYGISDVSQAVNDEYPGVYHSQMIAKWLEDGLKTNEVIPKTGNADFLRGPVFFSDMVGVAIRLVGSCNFALKWNVGLPRPEEIAWKIKTGEIIPPKFKSMINFTEAVEYLNYDGSQDFTDYDVGSPNHPSWPAMHSAASAGSFWLNIVADLTDEQLCEARKLDYAVSYARTVAGVHYPQDNIAGLMAGQEILLHELPGYLKKTYGSDKEMVKEKGRAAKYNWKDFTSSDCYLGKI